MVWVLTTYFLAWLVISTLAGLVCFFVARKILSFHPNSKKISWSIMISAPVTVSVFMAGYIILCNLDPGCWDTPFLQIIAWSLLSTGFFAAGIIFSLLPVLYIWEKHFGNYQPQKTMIFSPLLIVASLGIHTAEIFVLDLALSAVNLWVILPLWLPPFALGLVFHFGLSWMLTRNATLTAGIESQSEGT